MSLELDNLLRALLTFEALCALLFAGAYVGTVWHEKIWPLRVVLVGAAGILVYVLVGQLKAFNLSIPFDTISWIGLFAYTILLSGFTWQHSRERRTRRGR